MPALAGLLLSSSACTADRLADPDDGEAAQRRTDDQGEKPPEDAAPMYDALADVEAYIRESTEDQERLRRESTPEFRFEAERAKATALLHFRVGETIPRLVADGLAVASTMTVIVEGAVSIGRGSDAVPGAGQGITFDVPWGRYGDLETSITDAPYFEPNGEYVVMGNARIFTNPSHASADGVLRLDPKTQLFASVAGSFTKDTAYSLLVAAESHVTQ